MLQQDQSNLTPAVIPFSVDLFMEPSPYAEILQA